MRSWRKKRFENERVSRTVHVARLCMFLIYTLYTCAPLFTKAYLVRCDIKIDICWKIVVFSWCRACTYMIASLFVFRKHTEHIKEIANLSHDEPAEICICMSMNARRLGYVIGSWRGDQLKSGRNLLILRYGKKSRKTRHEYLNVLYIVVAASSGRAAINSSQSNSPTKYFRQWKS